ncbi:MAG TPA: DUF1735 domain-containing protein [Bacteroidales bacterium]|nr:DUF1735 domain-containing protein [Bacteroidales bacterium]
MKNGKYKLLALLTLALPLFLVSCLTDSDYEDGVIGIKPNENHFVEVHLTSGNNKNIVSRSYDAIGHDTTISLIPIHLTTTPTSDVTITFSVLDTLNRNVPPVGDTKPYYVLDSLVKIDGYSLPDPAKYVVLNTDMKVTIPAGQTTGYINVKFNPNDFIGATYVFGVRITSITGGDYTISNLTDGYVKFGVKNMYDGEYINTGTMVDHVNPVFTAGYPLLVDLITQDGSSVAYFDVEIWGDYFHAFKNGASWSGYGSFAPVFKFDANNNVISVVNLYGQPAGNGRKAELDATTPGVVNKYDPATRTLKVSYWMIQNGVYRTRFDETFTYEGSR